MTLSPQERAERSAEAMWANDHASQHFGFSLEEVGPGRATLAWTIESHHANGHGICHGGMIFALADSAFAFACNSHNAVTVAQHNSITFVAPGRVGDRLKASAREISRTGRSGITDVTVEREDGTIIAHFRGHSRTIGGTLFSEEEERTIADGRSET
ncbi:hydroxyphenylacetyl-CoA thioesterase PaaI [Notoacmeibacter ruber]|uniref:Hydroxyphenylacetyl-CoA thioesterase PaaI n=1 Tax=Notoacmeibacter ruber TaxID=2670375 RepID=A0A3L7JFN1_9HYPH|nr:hydroxyphenylacetyl-CoA thioesterase PaaI [Notoacmeibacter ruber]RLQ88401.1 hydroxyphenylacetyl-CoA thioesterase PaaI [Notoacmeibacter ruber]